MNLYRRVLSLPLPSLNFFWDRYLSTNPNPNSTIFSELRAIYNDSLSVKSQFLFSEITIKRYFFHITPVAESELQSWRLILNSLTEKDPKNEKRVITKLPFNLAKQVYERCLISCCSYTEFWDKYIDFIIKNSTKDEAKKLCEFGNSVKNILN